MRQLNATGKKRFADRGRESGERSRKMLKGHGFHSFKYN